ncbi:hypothetical protein J5N97_019211 [Dioscorea zingiberensis]|uniref:ENT domain-containing protein n=1 Tax=Dioscorea zingiberensis TaxID=325984 RepID=A0A9D5HCH8_9LILI|nr:hypothetical protein J5N97_019211 [Dioscorea zingiberensis]
MHRSASTTRASDEYLVSMAQGGSRSVMEMDQLPTYDPQSEAAKKEILRARFAQNMVHLIPLVLIFCALVLWFFSNPDIDLASKDDAILARIKNLTIDGYSNWNVSSMAMSLESLDPINASGVEQTGSVLENKFYQSPHIRKSSAIVAGFGVNLIMMRLTKGKGVEVLNRKDTSSSFWQPAVIISGNGRTYQIKYCSSGEEERVPRKVIRPHPPPMGCSKVWMVGDIVDAFVNDSWVHAEVLELEGRNFAFVRILGTTRVFGTRITDFRLPQSWEDNKWVMIHKKMRACNNVDRERQTAPADSSSFPSFSISTMESSSDPSFRKGARDFGDVNLVRKGISKKPRMRLPPGADCSGASRKLRIVKEGKKHQPHKVLSEKCRHASLKNNVTTGCLEADIDLESVGSCSINNGLHPSPNHQTSMPSHDFNIQDDDAESPFRLGVNPCVSSILTVKDRRPELVAYRYAMTALHASGPLKWEDETSLTNLRLALHISNDEHLSELKHFVSPETRSRLSLREAMSVAL